MPRGRCGWAAGQQAQPGALITYWISGADVASRWQLAKWLAPSLGSASRVGAKVGAGEQAPDWSRGQGETWTARGSLGSWRDPPHVCAFEVFAWPGIANESAERGAKEPLGQVGWSPSQGLLIGLWICLGVVRGGYLGASMKTGSGDRTQGGSRATRGVVARRRCCCVARAACM